MKTYDELALVYDEWSSGDRVYESSGLFYRNFVNLTQGLVVELGIGTGRIGGRIATDQNRFVIGVDTSGQMLDSCRSRFAPALANGRLSLVQEDMVEFVSPIPAQFVLLPFRTIGHLDTDDAVLTLFANTRRSLQANGVFVFDHYVLDQAWAAEQAGQPVRLYDDDSTLIEDSYRFDLKSRRMNCRVAVNGSKVSEFSFRWFDPDDVSTLVSRAGLVVNAIYGDFAGRPLTPASRDQIWVLGRG